LQKGALLKTYKGNGGIFEVHFNKTGEKLAACTSSKQVVILDMKS
jgi:transducin (beta)-like 1